MAERGEASVIREALLRASRTGAILDRAPGGMLVSGANGALNPYRTAILVMRAFARITKMAEREGFEPSVRY